MVDLWGFCLRRGRVGGAGRTPTKLFGFFNNWSIHSFYWDPQDVLDVENQYQNSAEWKYADNATLAGALGIIMIPALLSKSVEG